MPPRRSSSSLVRLALAFVPIWGIACASGPDEHTRGAGGSTASSGSNGLGSAGDGGKGAAGAGTSGVGTSGTGIAGTAGAAGGSGGTAAGVPGGGGGAGQGGGGAVAGGGADGAAGSVSGAGPSTGGAGAPGSGGAAQSGAGGSSGNDSPCPLGATLEPGDTQMTISVEGDEREFLFHAPPAYDGTTRLPVVFDFHGLGGTSNMQKGFSRWAAVGDDQGFITVFPQGLGSTPGWNAGACCNTIADDVAFVRAIILKLQAEACIDQQRVYASGCSNGGGMSFRLACEAADVVAGIAPVDFDCVLGSGCNDCAPSRPVPVVQFRGTSDTLVDYEGSGAFIGAKANLEKWGALNQCTGEPAPRDQPSSCEGFPACGGDVETLLCTVQNGTHCGSYASFMIPEVAWDILRQHVLP